MAAIEILLFGIAVLMVGLLIIRAVEAYLKNKGRHSAYEEIGRHTVYYPDCKIDYPHSH